MTLRILDLAGWFALGVALAALLLRAVPTLRYAPPAALATAAADGGAPPGEHGGRVERALTNNLFGLDVKEGPAASPEAALPPVGLRLLGTIAGGPEPAAIVQVEGADTTTVLYLGDRIGPERLKAVGGDAITLEGPGGRRTLAVGEKIERGVSAAFEAAADVQREVRRSDVNAAYGSVDEILAGIKPVPEFENGRVVGFRLAEVADSSLFARMGLKRDDVIQAVNGYRIRSYEEGLDAFQRLRRASEALVEVKRGDQTMNIGFILKP